MVRSAMAPDTIVAVVAQNTKLNTKEDQLKSPYVVKISNPGFPINPTRSSPNNKLKPIKINTTVPIQKSIKFFIMMLPAFFALVKPASTIANPACIQNTNAAPIRNQTPNTSLSTAFIISSISIPPFFKKIFSSACMHKKRCRRNIPTTPLPFMVFIIASFSFKSMSYFEVVQ